MRQHRRQFRFELAIIGKTNICLAIIRIANLPFRWHPPVNSFRYFCYIITICTGISGKSALASVSLQPLDIEVQA